MFYSKLLVVSLSIVMLIISMSLCFAFPYNNHSSNDDDVEVIPIDGGAFGPESFDFDRDDGSSPYTGVSDGRIIKWIASEKHWIDFAVTSKERDRCGEPEMEPICGRPLGLKMDKSRSDLYIADAYLGLLVVGPKGGLATSLVSQVEGLPLLFTNALDIDHENGLIYFSDSSQRYTRRDFMLILLTNDQTGRLLQYNLETKEVTVLLRNLSFPNGVALSQDGNFLLVAETTNCRVLRFWLKTHKAGTLEVFANLPGHPDNIKINKNGEFWVAMYPELTVFWRCISYIPWIVDTLSKLPIDIAKVSSYVPNIGGLAAKLGVDGEILQILEDVNGKIWKSASEVIERDGYLWIGSVESPSVVKLKIHD